MTCVSLGKILVRAHQSTELLTVSLDSYPLPTLLEEGIGIGPANAITGPYVDNRLGMIPRQQFRNVLAKDSLLAGIGKPLPPKGILYALQFMFKIFNTPLGSFRETHGGLRYSLSKPSTS
jgi:hypothetical protein